jgi:hypothetical protein
MDEGERAGTSFFETILGVNNFFDFPIYRPENFLTTKTEQ